MEDALAHLLEMRLRCRANPEAMAIVDRALALVARAEGADGEQFQRLQAEIENLRQELAERLGLPGNIVDD